MNTPLPMQRMGRILVVDDEPDNRELLEIVLRWEGFVVLSASGGEEALAIVAREMPDLILLDIMMPEMTGYQVVATLKLDVATRHIPVIMITALQDREARPRALSAGADDFLTKPITRGVLIPRVRAALMTTKKVETESMKPPAPEPQDRKPGRSFDDPNQALGAGILARSAPSTTTAEDFRSREVQADKPVNGVAERAKAIAVLRKLEELLADNNPSAHDEASLRTAHELASGRVGLTFPEYEALVKGDAELVELERKVLADARAHFH